MSLYKALYLDKIQSAIFGSDSNVKKSREGKKDPDVMEIDEVKKKKRRVYNNVRYVQAKALKIKQSYIIQ